jgi:phospholipase/carboxylesterase
MLEMKPLQGPSSYKFEGKRPTDLVVFLHGYGSCGKDLISLSQYFEDVLERPYFIAPNAPFTYEFVGATFPDEWQWFSLINRNPQNLIAGSKTAEPLINYFLDKKLAEFELTTQNLYLVGFSQGTMMSLHTAFRRSNGGCKAVIAFSGTMVAPELLEKEIISKPKVCFIHGEKDAIVPPSLGKIAYNYVVQNGVQAEFHKIPELEHYIDFNALNIAKNFILSIK